MIHNSKVTASLFEGLLAPQRFLEEECPRLIKFILDQKAGLVEESIPDCQQEVWVKMPRWSKLTLLHKMKGMFLVSMSLLHKASC